MSDHRNPLNGVMKVMLLSIALAIPLVKMIEHRWPARCFEGSGWWFLLILIPAGIVVWIVACRWVRCCTIFPGLLLTVLIAHAFLLGAAVGHVSVSDCWPGILVFLTIGPIYSVMFWGVLDNFNNSIDFRWWSVTMTLLMASVLFTLSVFTYTSSLYGFVTLLLGLGFLRHTKEEIKKQPAITRAVLVSHD